MKVSCKHLDIKISDMLFISISMVNLSVMLILDFILDGVDGISVAGIISVTMFISNLLYIQARSMSLDKEFGKLYGLNIMIIIAIFSLFTGNIYIILFSVYIPIRYLLAYIIEYTAYAAPKFYAMVGAPIVFLTVFTLLIFKQYIRDIGVAFLITATFSIFIVTFVLLLHFRLIKNVYNSLFINVVDSIKFIFYSNLRLSDAFVRAILDFTLLMLSITFVTKGVEWLELQYSVMIFFRVLDGIMVYMVTRYIVYINNNQLSYSYQGIKVVLKASLLLNILSALSIIVVLAVIGNSLNMIIYSVCLYFVLNILSVISKCLKVEFQKNNNYRVIALTMIIGVIGTLVNIYFKSVYLIPIILIIATLMENVVLCYYKQFKFKEVRLIWLRILKLLKEDYLTVRING